MVAITTNVMATIPVTRAIWPSNPSRPRYAESTRPPIVPESPSCFVVWIASKAIIATAAPSRLASNRVSFEPGARTAWHTHPLGQTLYVISGVGRVQAKGGPVREIRPGDFVWIPPNEKHWHGASPTNGMAHIAMQEALEGSYVTWMEYVTDAEYSESVG